MTANDWEWRFECLKIECLKPFAGNARRAAGAALPDAGAARCVTRRERATEDRERSGERDVPDDLS
jgi:hypothetical protein